MADKADIAPQFMADTVERMTIQQNIALVGFGKAADDADQGTLARTIVPQQRHHLPGGDLHFHPTQNALASISFVEVAHLDERPLFGVAGVDGFELCLKINHWGCALDQTVSGVARCRFVLRRFALVPLVSSRRGSPWLFRPKRRVRGHWPRPKSLSLTHRLSPTIRQ